MKLLIATKNPGKILEYREILKGLPLEIKNLEDLGIKESPEEEGKTFEENAVEKVKFYSERTSLPVLAEDSGMEIDCLGGEPGVKSRRWPGYEASDQELVDITMEKMKGALDRGAQLKAVIALKIEGEIKTFEGVLRGLITEKPISKIVPGYPFRSFFFLPSLGKVLGELTMEQETAVAHRKKAMEKALPLIKKHLHD